ncbi:MAG: hypothetical protein ACJ8E4_04985 [Sphingomicrobium sp.]
MTMEQLMEVGRKIRIHPKSRAAPASLEWTEDVPSILAIDISEIDQFNDLTATLSIFCWLSAFTGFFFRRRLTKNMTDMRSKRQKIHGASNS